MSVDYALIIVTGTHMTDLKTSRLHNTLRHMKVKIDVISEVIYYNIHVLITYMSYLIHDIEYFNWVYLYTLCAMERASLICHLGTHWTDIWVKPWES